MVTQQITSMILLAIESMDSSNRPPEKKTQVLFQLHAATPKLFIIQHQNSNKSTNWTIKLEVFQHAVKDTN